MTAMIALPAAPRLTDWQPRLQACLDVRWHRPFSWGTQDCCMLVFDAAEAITGRNPAADLRGYTTEAQAARLLKKLGGVHRIASTRFGAAIAPAFAGVGDVGLVETGGRQSLALCGGSHWIAPGALGLESLPFSAALAAWRLA
jgi:hypothetical protein